MDQRHRHRALDQQYHLARLAFGLANAGGNEALGDAHMALQRQACDLIMPDFMRIGGVTGWLRTAAIAGAAGIPVSTHLYPEVAAHVMRITETAHWLEWQDWADPILQQPYAIKDGLLQIPDRSGLGLDWDETAVRANLVQ